MLLALGEAAPAVEQAEAEVGRGEGGVAVRLDEGRREPAKAACGLLGGHVELEDHVAAEEEDGVGQDSFPVFDAEDYFCIRIFAHLLIQSSDEIGDGR